MAWRLADTPENRRDFPALMGREFLGSPPSYTKVTVVKDSPDTEAPISLVGYSSVGHSPPFPIVRCPCDCKSLPKFTEGEFRIAADYLHIKPQFPGAPKEEGYIYSNLLEGMNEELEHCDITDGDSILTAKIVLAHLREDPEYYVKLRKAGL